MLGPAKSRKRVRYTDDRICMIKLAVLIGIIMFMISLINPNIYYIILKIIFTTFSVTAILIIYVSIYQVYKE